MQMGAIVARAMMMRRRRHRRRRRRWKPTRGGPAQPTRRADHASRRPTKGAIVFAPGATLSPCADLIEARRASEAVRHAGAAPERAAKGRAERGNDLARRQGDRSTTSERAGERTSQPGSQPQPSLAS